MKNAAKGLSTIQKEFSGDLSIFQYDGATCYKAEIITKWFGDHQINIHSQKTPQILI